MNDNIEVSVFFKAMLIFELEKLRYMSLFGEVKLDDSKKKKRKKKKKNQDKDKN